MSPHIVTMNEVTENFYKLLQSNEEIRKTYYISCFPYRQKDGSYNVIISREKPLGLKKIKLNNLERNLKKKKMRIRLFQKLKVISTSFAHCLKLKRQKKKKNKKRKMKNNISINRKKRRKFSR